MLQSGPAGFMRSDWSLFFVICMKNVVEGFIPYRIDTLILAKRRSSVKGLMIVNSGMAIKLSSFI